MKFNFTRFIADLPGPPRVTAQEVIHFSLQKYFPPSRRWMRQVLTKHDLDQHRVSRQYCARQTAGKTIKNA
jgi:hypothetical protein